MQTLFLVHLFSIFSIPIPKYNNLYSSSFSLPFLQPLLEPISQPSLDFSKLIPLESLPKLYLIKELSLLSTLLQLNPLQYASSSPSSLDTFRSFFSYRSHFDTISSK